MRRARADFKYTLRWCKAEEHMRAEALSEKLRGRQVRSFWREVRALTPQTNSLPEQVDEAVGENEIAGKWQRKFGSVLSEIEDSCEEVKLLEELTRTPNSGITQVSVNKLQRITNSLPLSKAIGRDGIPNEFFKYPPLPILIQVSLYFNCFLTHSFVPQGVMDVLIVPLVKSKLKDATLSSNYRPLAIATAVSKVFEQLLYNRLIAFLHSSDNQFGFKKHHSTEMCIYSLKETINYYHDLNIPVFICFIDVESAFDRVSYFKVFSKLLACGTLVYLVQLLQHWYTRQLLQVRWGGAVSAPFPMHNGIRQGSVLSPHLFSLYVDELNVMLNSSGVGCHIAGVAANNFSYADDLALVCPSAAALSGLL